MLTVVAALKDAELTTYHGEGLVVLPPGNIADEYRRPLEFLTEHIGNRGPMANVESP